MMGMWRQYYIPLAIAIGALLSGCAPVQTGDDAQGAAEGTASQRPARIVSLDYCADQYLLALKDRHDILALSPLAEEDYSYLRAKAAGIRKVRARAEDVLSLKPDLVVRTYGGGPGAAALFKRAGVPVLQIGYASDIEGIKQTLKDAAEGLGESARGEALLLDFENRLAAIAEKNQPGHARKNALYITPGGVTAGSGTLIDEILQAAQLENFAVDPGWRSLPLERLAREKPDTLAAAFFSSSASQVDAWSAARHPVIRTMIKDIPSVSLNSAWTSCGAWYAIDAIEALAQAPETDAP